MADAADITVALRVELVRSLRPGEVEHADLVLSAGATVAAALAAQRWTVPADCRVAVWGRLLAPDAVATTALADRDRVELLRPLAVDPKEARRRRERTQHAGRPARGISRGTSAG